MLFCTLVDGTEKEKSIIYLYCLNNNPTKVFYNQKIILLAERQTD
jgi:hypothetical protein